MGRHREKRETLVRTYAPPPPRLAEAAPRHTREAAANPLESLEFAESFTISLAVLNPGAYDVWAAKETR